MSETDDRRKYRINPLNKRRLDILCIIIQETEGQKIHSSDLINRSIELLYNQVLQQAEENGTFNIFVKTAMELKSS